MQMPTASRASLEVGLMQSGRNFASIEVTVGVAKTVPTRVQFSKVKAAYVYI